MKYGLVLVAVVGCSDPHAASVDAPKSIDGELRDASIDAKPDAPPDAAVFTPSCTTTPTLLYDSFPREIANIARSGNTLYVSAYQVQNQTVTDPAIVPIDLTTGIAGTPFIPAAASSLWPADGAVIADEYVADGTIWRFDGTPTPTQVTLHRSQPAAATEAGGYVYWGESDGMVRRQLITGGPIEPVYACGAQIRDLVVVGTDLFCVYSDRVMRGLAAGGSIPEGIGFAATSYPIGTMVGDGTTLYFVDLDPMPQLFQLPVASSTATVADQWTLFGRYYGLAIDGPTLYETSSRGLHKMNRATFTSELIVPTLLTKGDPVIWNADLYFTEEDTNVAGQRYVMHCVD